MSKILIIDDEIGICLIVSKFLTKNGYITSTAESGAIAFSKLEKEKFDLVLSDFRLEDTDGREILRKIKFYALVIFNLSINLFFLLSLSFVLKQNYN